MVVSGQFHVPATSFLGNETHRKEVGWTPQPVWMLWRSEWSLLLPGVEPWFPACSLVTILTDLFQSPLNIVVILLCYILLSHICNIYVYKKMLWWWENLIFKFWQIYTFSASLIMKMWFLSVCLSICEWLDGFCSYLVPREYNIQDTKIGVLQLGPKQNGDFIKNSSSDFD
jgi:hypothetical protein